MGRIFDWFAALDRRVLYGGAAALGVGIVVLSLFAFGVFGGDGDSGPATTVATATTDPSGTTDGSATTDGTGPTTLPPEASADGAILTVTGAADGSSLPVVVGTEVTVRLPAEIEGDLWRITTPPDQEILTFGGSIFFVPSDPTEADPYQEFTFTARAAGSTTVVISQGSEGDDTPTFGFTVSVVDA